MSVSPEELRFSAIEAEASPPSQSLEITFEGQGVSSWVITTDAAWLSVSPDAGSSSGVVAVSVDSTGMGLGTHQANATISAPGASPPSVVVPVSVTVFPATCRGLFFAGQIVRADDVCRGAPVPTDDDNRLLEGIPVEVLCGGPREIVSGLVHGPSLLSPEFSVHGPASLLAPLPLDGVSEVPEPREHARLDLPTGFPGGRDLP